MLTHKGAPIGEKQSSGEGTNVPLDSTSPVVMTNLARKVLFIDGKTSMAHSKTGLAQREKSVGLDMDPEDGRQQGEVRLLRRMGGTQNLSL